MEIGELGRTAAGADIDSKAVDSEVEARVNNGYRRLIKDLSMWFHFDLSPESLAQCRAVIDSRLDAGDYPERSRKVISLRYGIDGQPTLVLAEVGKQLNITTERARQLQLKALKDLRNRRGTSTTMAELANILGIEPR